ncbi:hypothetical protein BU16DRAFT_482554 [Lophium mytilinum]|uniref:Uncharacterized protein n=1 Tax=Lophium mytilinum TaxID=390894 RepID=A0A6A6QZ46_9PEZI|nr:hypothetical protein BU16DRAFT_482554 [Lophium mytilinum]
MATAADVTLSDLHAPKEASITAFTSALPEIKRKLLYHRHQDNIHDKGYFRAVASVDNKDLESFTASDLEAVRVGSTAYGLHLFCKVALPAAPGSYIHVRLFIAAEDGTDGASLEDRVATVHCIHTEEVVKEGAPREYRAIFGKEDALEWFDT